MERDREDFFTHLFTFIPFKPFPLHISNPHLVMCITPIDLKLKKC